VQVDEPVRPAGGRVVNDDPCGLHYVTTMQRDGVRTVTNRRLSSMP
jgi:hypothetical protein